MESDLLIGRVQWEGGTVQRIPEPELMDDDAQARAYAEADFAEPHDRFVALLGDRFPDLPARGVALDLGCGPADVTLRFARAFPGWTIDGLDASPAMLRYGHAAVERAGLGRRVSLLQAYLPDGAAPRPPYDLVFSNSLLHHLHDPLTLWQCTQRWVRPGGVVFVMDLMRPATRATARRLVDLYAAGESDILQRDFFNSLLAAYEVSEVKTQLAAANVTHLQVEAASDRHLIAWGCSG